MSSRIGFLLFPGVTQLDMTGPAQVLHRMPGAKLDYVWHDLEPVMSDCDLALKPNATFADGHAYDIICVPGGFGFAQAAVDPVVTDWLRGQAEHARYMTSVCNGSLILGAAGLLRGYRAACHWAWGHVLERFGATWVRERVVIDRNRITAGGVTSGIDFAFTIVAEMHGRDVEETIQLGIEYDPAPLGGGTPDKARPEVLARYQRAAGGIIAAREAEFLAMLEPQASA